MITFSQWYGQWPNKRKLYYALVEGAPAWRVRELMALIPYDPS